MNKFKKNTNFKKILEIFLEKIIFQVRLYKTNKNQVYLNFKYPYLKISHLK